MSASVLEEGTRDIGPYRLATRIAAGATSEVFRALKRQAAGADRAVVIKRLLPSLAASSEARGMFEHEAKLGLRVRHPSVVEVLDYDTDGECPYLVLEYVFGVDLRRLVRWLGKEQRRMPLALAAWITTQIAAGLDAVHTAVDEHGRPLGIVHRDVSPSNVFVSVHGDVKLGDLGIARALGDLGRSLGPRSAQAKGKLGYLAPEQVAGAPADVRSDVFAAATIGAELLVGEPLFSRGSELDVLLAIRDARTDAVALAAREWPEGLGRVLLEGLAREPSERTPSAAALRLALAPYVDEPESSLRAMLGTLVVGAMDAAPDTDAVSLARTVESTSQAAVVREGEARTGERRERETLRPGAGSLYTVHQGAESLGPWPYARLVQALHTGEVERSSMISMDGGAPRPVGGFRELAPHLPPSSRISTQPPPPMRPPSKLGRTGESWDLSTFGFATVLVHLLVDRDTGLLLCELDGTRKEIFVEDGAPTFVTSNRLGDMLGEHLVAAGVIERSGLDVALAAMPRFEGRLGDTLVALGLLEPLELFAHLAGLERDKLLDVFDWRRGRAALYRQASRPTRGFPLQLDAWGLLRAGLSRGLETGHKTLRGHDVLVRVPDFDPSEVALPPHLEGLLESLTVPRAVAEVVGTASERADVLLLSELGALRVMEGPKTGTSRRPPT